MEIDPKSPNQGPQQDLPISPDRPKTTANTPGPKEGLLRAGLDLVDRDQLANLEGLLGQDGATLLASCATLAPGRPQAYNTDLPLADQDDYYQPVLRYLPADAGPTLLAHEREILVSPATDSELRTPLVITQPSSDPQGSALSQIMDDLSLRNVFMYPAHNFALRQQSAQ